MSTLEDECRELEAQLQVKQERLRRIQERERQRAVKAKNMKHLEMFKVSLQQNWTLWLAKEDWLREEVQELPGCERIGRNPEIARLLNERFGSHFTFRYDRDYNDYPRLYICPRFKIQESELDFDVPLEKEKGSTTSDH